MKYKVTDVSSFRKNIKKKQAGGMSHVDAVTGAMGKLGQSSPSKLKQVQKTKKFKQGF